tara:strand:+ start:572 stop:949 length:378 start_codon:yes stop_codon:yes gene_type:complete
MPDILLGVRSENLRIIDYEPVEGRVQMAIRRAHASHILVPSKGQANQLVEKIKDARKPFKEFQKMAKKHSTCPSGSKGGDLGWFHERQMVKEFSDAVWTQDLKTVDGFIRTGFGYHIIYVHERDE